MITFDPEMRPELIMIVGLGGTGSQLARLVARICYDLALRRIQTPAIAFVDPDKVEAKNVGRQMFTSADVGSYKAEVLARRLNYALGLNISYCNESFDPEWFGSESQFRESSRIGSRYKYILLGAVDNAKARQDIAKVESLWIDCGNHFSSGQVVIGNSNDRGEVMGALHEAMEGKKPSMTTALLPDVATLFPAMLEEVEAPQPDLSCADLVSMGEQHLLINDMVASVAANYVFKILHRQSITSFISYIDLQGMNVRSLPITRDALEVYMPKPARAG